MIRQSHPIILAATLKLNVAEQNPEVVAKIEAAVRQHQNGVVSVPEQLKR